MIDLSHLTEEEQGVIMTVLRRDAELKKAEEERIRKLETILNNDAQSDYQLKYLTGEWFYEAKSRRHMDKIHGSEIILASMKQRKASGLEGSLRLERFKAPSSRGSDVAAPPKPARCLEATQPQEMNDPEKENLNSAVRSPRTPRHNPFNRASLIIVDPPENPEVLPKARDQDPCETEPISPLKSTSEGGQTLGGSITSESSSVGFRPVPKKRTFLSRRSSSQTDSNSNSNSNSNGLGSDTQVHPVITPAPRRSIRRGSSGSSHHLRGQDVKPEKTVASAAPNHAPLQPAPAFVSAEEHQPPLRDAPHAPTNSNSEKDRTPPCQTTDSFRPTTHSRSNASVDREIPQKREERGGPAQREYAGANTVAALAGGVRDSDREISSSSASSSAKRQAELSLTQSIPSADPPMSYDLNFIDTFEQPSQKKSTQKHVFKLSNQTTSPTADEEDSIAKVLDWFSRSTDSSDWLNGEDGPEVAKCSDRRTEIMGSEELLRKDVGDVKNDGRKESVDMKRGQRQSSEGKELRGNKEVIRTQEEVKKDVRERTRSLDMQDSEDVSQSPQISQLKSFWESSSTYPKIQKSTIYKEPIDLMLDTDEEKVSNTSLSDIHSTGLYNGKGIYDQYTSNDVDEREKKMVISTQKDISNSEHAHLNNNNNNKDLNGVHSVKQQIPASQKNYNDQPFNTDYFKLASSKAADGGDEEILCVTRLSPTPPWSESQDVSLAQPKLDFPPRKPSLMSQDISFTQPKPDFPLRKPSLQEELLKPLPQPQLDVDLKSLDPQKLHTSRNNQQADHKPGGNEVQSVPKSPRHHAGSIEDLRTKDDEDKSLQKKKEEAPKDKTSTPHSERIRQLKSFWEQERSKPMFYTGKPKTLDGKPSRGPKLNKRFTKSEYDLRSIGNGSGSDDEAKNPVRLDKLSPSLGASRAQFNTLREFWGEATSDSKGSLSSDKSKSPKRKEPICLVPQTPPEPELHRTSSVKSNNERQTGPRASSEGKNNHAMAEASPQREPRRMSKDSGREEKAGKPQSYTGKEPRSPKSKKDSFSSSSSRGSSLRRATSMFSLSGPEEKDQGLFRIDVSPVHSHSRKQSRRYNMGAADDSEGLTPRARAFVPTDYRHYLGMTDKTKVHAPPAPPAKDEAPDDKAHYDLDLDEAPRASTPLGSEERYGKKAIKMSPRHQWTNYSSSDTGQESSVSSTSETWPASRTVSARENDDEDMNPVRKALRRAEARPKTVAKSMEDITAALSPRQERRPDPVVDKRRISDVSSIPSASSSFSDPEHLKNMSKSVPSFLQKELSGSVMTMYGGDFGNVEVQGNIQFSINYVQRLREFHIFVAECRDLAAVDPKRGRSDPYVKSYLVPDKANLGKRKTSVKKKTLNPSFNEILRYRVRMEYLRTQTLILSVWHNDTFGRNSFLGEVDVDLATWDFDHTQMNYLPLKARTAPTVAPTNGQGEMRLAIRYLPQIIHSEGLAKEGSTTGEVHIWVKDCKNLPLIRSAIDPYVKCFVLPDTSRKSRQKTRVLRRTADPVFNHTMVYDGIREADLTEACVELTVWDRDRLASNLLGGLRLGSGTGKSYGAVVDWMDSTPYEAALWDRMVASPNEWVEDVLPLRVLNSAKTAFK